MQQSTYALKVFHRAHWQYLLSIFPQIVGKLLGVAQRCKMVGLHFLGADTQATLLAPLRMLKKKVSHLLRALNIWRGLCIPRRLLHGQPWVRALVW